MFNKKLVAGISLFVSIAAIAGYFILSEKEEKPSSPDLIEEKQVQIPQVKSKNKSSDKHVVQKVPVHKTNLYNSTEKNMPLSAISDLTKISDNARETVNNIIENSSNGIYFLKYSNDKIVTLADNSNQEESVIKRHNFDFIEISALDGAILNYKNLEPDSKYDKWEYKNDLPLKHIHYNDQKELKYTEIWNYSEDEPVKYKKTDENNQIISLRKEVVDNETNLREEHLFYDNEGNMVQNVSFNYDGLDLTRFTYYNSETPDESAMIVSEFEDGVKQKETLYSADYKIEKIYIPEYKEGQKSAIKVLDKDNAVIEELVDL